MTNFVFHWSCPNWPILINSTFVNGRNDQLAQDISPVHESGPDRTFLSFARRCAQFISAHQLSLSECLPCDTQKDLDTRLRVIQTFLRLEIRFKIEKIISGDRVIE